MKLFIAPTLLRPVLISGALCPILLFAGCSSEPKPSSAEEVKAFKGDPQKIAEGEAKSTEGRAKAEQESKKAGR